MGHRRTTHDAANIRPRQAGRPFEAASTSHGRRTLEHVCSAPPSNSDDVSSGHEGVDYIDLPPIHSLNYSPGFAVNAATRRRPSANLDGPAEHKVCESAGGGWGTLRGAARSHHPHVAPRPASGGAYCAGPRSSRTRMLRPGRRRVGRTARCSRPHIAPRPAWAGAYCAGPRRSRTHILRAGRRRVWRTARAREALPPAYCASAGVGWGTLQGAPARILRAGRRWLGRTARAREALPPAYCAPAGVGWGALRGHAQFSATHIGTRRLQCDYDRFSQCYMTSLLYTTLT